MHNNSTNTLAQICHAKEHKSNLHFYHPSKEQEKKSANHPLMEEKTHLTLRSQYYSWQISTHGSNRKNQKTLWSQILLTDFHLSIEQKKPKRLFDHRFTLIQHTPENRKEAKRTTPFTNIIFRCL